MKEIILLMFLGHILGMFVSANFEIVDVKDWCEMSKVGMCLGGVECGKTVIDTMDFYEIPDDYKRIDLKFIKEVAQHGKTVKYALQQTLDIYVPKDGYDKYEFALKVLLNNYLDANWELVKWQEW